MSAWRGSLRDPTAPDRTRWDWGWLKDSFGTTRISLTDVDGLLYAVERKGCLIWIEVKRVGQDLPTGQRWALEAFSMKPDCLALVLWGDRDSPEIRQWISDGFAWPARPTCREAMAKEIASWFKWANAAPHDSQSPRKPQP